MTLHIYLKPGETKDYTCCKGFTGRVVWHYPSMLKMLLSRLRKERR